MTAGRMVWLCGELVLLWFGLPVLLWRIAELAGYHIHALVVAALYAAAVTARERPCGRDLGFRDRPAFRASLAAGAPWVGLSLAGLVGVARALDAAPEVRAWSPASALPLGAIALFYPAGSVTSQEFLYSSFFFWRYRPLFSPGFLAGLNAVAFATAHLVYDSWVPVALALAGRVLLVDVYRRFGSFWGVWALHVLLGLCVFLAGLGGYFYRRLGPG
jgi:hypothetical protein